MQKESDELRKKKSNNTEMQIYFERSKELAAKGDARGYHGLAFFYRGGWDVVETNHQLADKNLELAAKQGHVGACIELIRKCLEGNDPNISEALKYIDSGQKHLNSTKFDTGIYKQAEFIQEFVGYCEEVDRRVESSNFQLGRKNIV